MRSLTDAEKEIISKHALWLRDEAGGVRADLVGADLGGANLGGADLGGAYLGGAYLGGADLGGAKNADYAIALTRILPDGDIIGWKKCQPNGDKMVLVKLSIPADAKRSSAFGRKCRCERAVVLEIIGAKEGVTHDHDTNADFFYRVGETVKPNKPFCEDFTQECASGIHFFITKLEAERYQ